MIHKLKILPKYFQKVLSEEKNFEIRKDRGFEVGDVIVLNEWTDDVKTYTGRSVVRVISYISRDVPDYGLMSGFVVLSCKIQRS